SLFGRPSLIIAGDARPLTLVQKAAIGTVGCGGAGQIALVRLFPGARLVFGIVGDHVGAIMHPAVPAGRNCGGICITGIGHIAAICLAILIVAVTELIGANILAETLDPEARAPSVAAPPGENFREKLLDTGVGHVSIPRLASRIGWDVA